MTCDLYGNKKSYIKHSLMLVATTTALSSILVLSGCHAESGVSKDINTVISTGESADQEYQNLQSEYEQGNKNFNDAKNAEEKRQDDPTGDSSLGRKELNGVKDNLQKKV